ncbi:MAG: quinone-dependent dihydroorotate dehydrogenase [Steroidobacteraceae bacterium]|jgi:dihydroorotate dehydrogenase|nr:quinone-dependent dihydroorotate dehydrogenase [Steroidobacteraceae bacterium]
MSYRLLRPLVFLADPERAHGWGLEALRRLERLESGRLHKASALAPLLASLRGGAADLPPEAPVELLGLRFPNRVGLAAGFDKNATCVDGLGALGFGFVEVGTVTPRPQPGQAKPRVFRLPSAEALINRMGFPNEGAARAAERLRHRQYRGIVGVNIGKNADTPLDRATDDYLACLDTVHAVADYVAVNISSPNTAGLRDLQEADRLAPMLDALLERRAELAKTNGREVPLLVKIAPDLTEPAIAAIVGLIQRSGLDGVIATNSTVSRQYVGGLEHANEAGGLSGAPLRHLSLHVVRQLRQRLGPAFPIIGVGGINSPQAALEMRVAGADLVQLYTALVYEGPRIVTELRRALAPPPTAPAIAAY